MKKLVSFLLAAVMLLAVCVSASAEITLTSEYYEAILNKAGNTLAACFERGTGYYITDLYGNKLSDTEYSNVHYDSESGLFKVEQKTGDINNTGVADAFGKQLVPCAYTGVEILSDKWVLGKHTVAADENNYDYRVSTSDGTEFAIIDAYDVYFMGEKVGSLGRLDFYMGYAYGDYLVIKNEAGDYNGYNSRLEKSDIKSDTNAEYIEVKENGERVYYHVGSGQKVFCPECTLTDDEVSQSLRSDNKYNFYDLQGDLVFSAGDTVKYVSKFNGRYAKAESNSGKGLIRDDGVIVVSCQYSDLNYLNAFKDYIAVSVGGNLGYSDLNGNLVCQTNYPYGSFRVYNKFSYIKDLDGSYVLVTPMGQIDRHFAAVQIVYTAYGDIVGVQETTGEVGVIDIYGNDVLTPNGCYKYADNIVISDDGTVIVARNTDTRSYEVYTVELEGTAPAVETAPAEETEPAAHDTGDSAPEAQAAPAEDGTWVCETCGQTNSGNFCPNDGTKKPEPAGWTCPVCGSVIESNFCPNDGTKKPE